MSAGRDRTAPCASKDTYSEASAAARVSKWALGACNKALTSKVSRIVTGVKMHGMHTHPKAREMHSDRQS